MPEWAIQLKAEGLKAQAQPTRLKIQEGIRGRDRCICEIVPEIHDEPSTISRRISMTQKNHRIRTRKDGIRVMGKVKDPAIFDLLDRPQVPS